MDLYFIRSPITTIILTLHMEEPKCTNQSNVKVFVTLHTVLLQSDTVATIFLCSFQCGQQYTQPLSPAVRCGKDSQNTNTPRDCSVSVSSNYQSHVRAPCIPAMTTIRGRRLIEKIQYVGCCNCMEFIEVITVFKFIPVHVGQVCFHHPLLVHQ